MPAYRVIFRREIVIYVAGVDRSAIKSAVDAMIDEDVERIADTGSWHREVQGHGVPPQRADHIIVAGKIVRAEPVTALSLAEDALEAQKKDGAP